MSKKRAAGDLARVPIGLGREDAAGYIGVSATTFDRMVSDGMMPPARRIYGRKVWDADECTQWFRRLPYEFEPDQGRDSFSPYANVRA